MTIKSLKIEGLFGHINKSIQFDEELTILVGINGSGKTMVLKLIEWLFMPSIPDLCLTEFDRIKLTFEQNNKEYIINCAHFESAFIYFLEEEGKKLEHFDFKYHFSSVR